MRNAKTVALTTNSSISTAANAGAIGKGGDVSIQTGLFSIDRNAQIIASTAAQNQNAGDVTIGANVVDASSQGQILTTTSSNGKAGNITLNVADRVTLADPQTAILANTARGSSGNGGTITIAPRLMEIKNGARIAVDSQGSGEGGSIAINGGQMTLSKGAVTAQSASAQGGNIALDLKDVILLRRNSVISATAGTDLAGGNGGNVTIKTPFLLGVLAENSDITANAFRGNGGNITITANQVFGLLPQPQDTRFSDITASSALGINGNVILNTLNIDPSRGLQDLNLIPVDPSKLVAQTCNSNRPVVEGESRFVIVGRGGLSASPDDPVGGTAILNDLGHSVVGATTAALIPRSAATAPTSIVEAQSLIQGHDGALYLVTLASPDALPISTQPLQGRSCH